MVDTQASARAARAIVDDVRALGIGEVTAVFNTHEHFDHTFGNGAFREAFGAIPIHAQEVAAARTVEAGERIKELFADEHDDPHREDVLETEIVVADHTFSSVRVLDLGDRQVELAHPGRGHTAGDAVLRVPDADVVLTGDLIEESGPPAYGDGLSPPGVAGDARRRDRPDRPRHGGRARPRSAGRPRLRRAAAPGHRDHRPDDPRPRGSRDPGRPALAEAEWPFAREA